MDGEARKRFVDKAVARSIGGECLDGLRRAQHCFHTQLPGQLQEQLRESGTAGPDKGRLGGSHLGLLAHDWFELPGLRARLGLLKELFLPSGADLLHRYGKKNGLWLPWLYLRQVVGGVYTRLTLR